MPPSYDADPFRYLRRRNLAGRPLADPFGLPASVASMVAAGDSIVAGANASTTNNRYVNIVAAALGATLNNIGIAGTVRQNSADSSGNPRANNLEDIYVAQMTGANKKNLALIGGSASDPRYLAAPATFNLANYAASTRRIIQGLIQRGYTTNRIILETPPWYPDAGFNTSSNPEFRGQTREGYERFVYSDIAIAKEFGIYLADTYSAGRAYGPAGIDSADWLHPNDAGHAVRAQAVLAAQLQISDAHAYDSFSHSDGSLLNGRRGEVGAVWTVSPYYSSAGAPIITQQRLYSDQSTNVWFASGRATQQACEAQALVRCLSVIASQGVAVILHYDPLGPNRFYWAGYTQGIGWRLFANVDGSNNIIGSAVNTAFNANEWNLVTLRKDAQGYVSLRVNGVAIITSPAPDNQITTLGHGGLRLVGAVASGTGMQVEDFMMRPIPAQT